MMVPCVRVVECSQYLGYYGGVLTAMNTTYVQCATMVINTASNIDSTELTDLMLNCEPCYPLVSNPLILFVCDKNVNGTSKKKQEGGI
jgi:hypothetical protein